MAPAGWSRSALATGDSAGELGGGAIGLGDTDDRPRVGLSGALVRHLGGASEGEGGPAGGGLGGDVDHHGLAQALAQAQDARLQVRLVLLGGVVLGVLLEVAVTTRGEDAGRDVAAGDGFELADLGLERRKPLFGDGLAVVV